MKYIILLFLVYFVYGDEATLGERQIVSAVIESCRGCQLNRLPEIKQFIYEDVPQYKDVTFKHIQGAPPEIIFLNKYEKELERVSLGQLTRDECNKLLLEKGFSKKVDVPPRDDF